MTINAVKSPANKQIAEQTAKHLLSTGCVMFAESNENLFTLTSGEKSPVYVDCRRLISYPKERSEITKLTKEHLEQSIDLSAIDYIAGGETAGIPYAAWLADSSNKPMLYVRKKPKGFGRMSQIEGNLPNDPSLNVLLVEDMATDGGSKVLFVDALREAGVKVSHVFCPFFYDIFPRSEEIFQKAGFALHYLTTWKDIIAVAEKEQLFDQNRIDTVKDFLNNPDYWRKKNTA